MRWPEVRRGYSHEARLSTVVLVALIAVFAGCDMPGEGDLEVGVFALGSCPGKPAMEPESMRVVVRGPVACDPSEADQPGGCSKEFASRRVRWGADANVGNIPEGTGREVSVFLCSPGPGLAGGIDEQHCGRDSHVAGYARASNVTIRRGESTPIQAILSRFGEQSCPRLPEEPAFTPRVFSSATPVDDGRVVVAGGFTALSGEGADRFFSGPDNGVFVYDPLTGKLSHAAELRRARGAHTAAFIPGYNWVVFFGGAARLSAPDDDGFPLSHAGEQEAFSDYEVFDLNTGRMLDDRCPPAPCVACCDREGERLPDAPEQCDRAGVDCVADCLCDCDAPRNMYRGRLLAQPAVMSDGFVIVSGGGDWPNHQNTDYRVAEVFDPAANCFTGGFQGPGALPRMESLRAGHSVSFIEATQAGRYRYLFWGGTRDQGSMEPGIHPIGETYAESSRQADFISGVFRQVYMETPGYARNLYFHTMTRLDSRRFLVAGGVRNDGERLLPPNADDYYLVTLRDDGDMMRAAIEPVHEGAPGGRFLHNATSHDGRRVLLFGGLDGFNLNAISEPLLFDSAPDMLGFGGPPLGLPPDPRVGHRATLLPDDTILLIGGVADGDGLTGGARSSGRVEIYTPTIVGTW